MEQIKELTKRLIANSFKELMLQMPFEKITIKTITDHANVIRPTFYNHFHDKYELVEWILKEEIINRAANLLIEGRATAAISALFEGFFEDKEYYRKAFEIGGQNGFADTLSKLITETLGSVIQDSRYADNRLLTTEVLAQYYASGLITVIRLEIYREEELPLDEIIGAYKFLVKHTIYDLIEDGTK